MAAGDHKFSKTYHLQQGKTVEVFFKRTIEGSDGEKLSRTGSRSMDWDTFWGSLSASEKSTLQGIDNKVTAWLKANVSELSQAVEE